MMGHIAVSDCKALAAAVEKAGGAVPARLQNLLDGYDHLVGRATQPPEDPNRAIWDAYEKGDHDRAAALMASAGQEQANVDYFIGQRQRGEKECTERFFAALRDGAADAILDSLRDRFDEAARTLAAATDLIDINADLASLVENGTTEQLKAWRAIRPAVTSLDTISAIARRFGPRSLDFGVLDQPPLVDPHGVLDEAVMCCSDDIIQAGSVFRARTAAISTAPWLRVKPALNSIEQGRERLRAWAEVQWNLQSSGSRSGHIGENGEIVWDQRRNPFAKEPAEAKV